MALSHCRAGLCEVGMRFRSPPPLPSIFLMEGHLTKTRGGKKGQIRAMIRFCVFFSAARVTTGSEIVNTLQQPTLTPSGATSAVTGHLDLEFQALTRNRQGPKALKRRTRELLLFPDCSFEASEFRTQISGRIGADAEMQ